MVTIAAYLQSVDEHNVVTIAAYLQSVDEHDVVALAALRQFFPSLVGLLLLALFRNGMQINPSVTGS